MITHAAGLIAHAREETARSTEEKTQPTASWRGELKTVSLVMGAVSRCCFCDHSISRQRLNGDNIFIAGPRDKVLTMGALLKTRWGARDQLLGAGSGDQRTSHFQSTASLVQRRFGRLAADLRPPRGCSMSCDGLNRNHLPKPFTSPTVVDNTSANRADSQRFFHDVEKRLYQRIVARLNSLAHDRLDLWYATFVSCSAACAPNLGDLQAARRVGRYLRKIPGHGKGLPSVSPHPGCSSVTQKLTWRRTTSPGGRQAEVLSRLAVESSAASQKQRSQTALLSWLPTVRAAAPWPQFRVEACGIGKVCCCKKQSWTLT